MGALRMKHAEQRLVGMSHAAGGIERQDAGGNAFQNGFRLSTALFELGISSAQVPAGGLDLPAAAFEFFGHSVERAHQVANLISSADIHAVVEASA